MKSHFKNLITLMLLILLISCTKEKDAKETLNFEGQLTNSTTCKNFAIKSGSDFTADTISKIEYDYNSATHVLKLKHVNAGFNCCPGLLSAQVTLSEEIISITEQEEEALCHCNCLYDLNFEITRVAQEKYKINFIEPYAENMPKLEFEINLLQNTEGSFAVIRKTYPWGVSSIN